MASRKWQSRLFSLTRFHTRPCTARENDGTLYRARERRHLVTRANKKLIPRLTLYRARSRVQHAALARVLRCFVAVVCRCLFATDDMGVRAIVEGAEERVMGKIE